MRAVQGQNRATVPNIRRTAAVVSQSLRECPNFDHNRRTCNPSAELPVKFSPPVKKMLWKR
jgi:hypothetical protein